VTTITLPSTGYTAGMTKKIGVSLPDDLYSWMQDQVKVGVAPSVSGLIAEVVERERSRAELSGLVADLVDEFGAPTDADMQRIDEALAALRDLQAAEQAVHEQVQRDDKGAAGQADVA
jgi:Arc/MetJ-type ribon-helix-helix transcriptional regulator